jgi:hypothetical protein
MMAFKSDLNCIRPYKQWKQKRKNI